MGVLPPCPCLRDFIPQTPIFASRGFKPLCGNYSDASRFTMAAIASTLLKLSGMISVAGMEMSNSSFSAPMSWMMSSEESRPSSMRVVQVSKSMPSAISPSRSRMVSLMIIHSFMCWIG